MSQGEDTISEPKDKVAELEQSDTKIKQWEGTSGNSNINITSSKDQIYEWLWRFNYNSIGRDRIPRSNLALETSWIREIQVQTLAQ